MQKLPKDTQVVMWPKSQVREVHAGETATITGPVTEADDVLAKLVAEVPVRYLGQLIRKASKAGELPVRPERIFGLYELLASVEVLPVEEGAAAGVSAIMLPSGRVARVYKGL